MRKQIKTKTETAIATVVVPAAVPAKPDAAAKAVAIAAAKAAAAAAIHARDAGRISIPVKAAAGFKAYRRDPGNNPKKPTVRQAACIAVALAASGKPLSDGETFPRRFNLSGEAVCVENGCAADMRGVLADYDATTETFTLRPGASAEIAGLIGKL